MNVGHQSDRELYWLVGIHLTFVVSTIVLALAERFGPVSTHPSDGETKTSERYFSKAMLRRSGGKAERGSGGLACPDGDAAPRR